MRGPLVKRLKYQAEILEEPLSAFQTGIMEWYAAQGRDLPWRHTKNPYYILVSEIMLHQTTVRTVIPVYLKFIETFPTIEDLAQATEDEVKAISDPLGYKIRGTWLHRIARRVLEEFGGQFPTTVEALLSLPGVGRYTAGAILSFAFEQDAPILDTNVSRLLGRFFAVDYKDPKAETKHQLWALAESVIPPGQGAVFNQALMDMGALICTARKPLCTVCPVQVACRANQEVATWQAAEEKIPYRIKKRELLEENG